MNTWGRRSLECRKSVDPRLNLISDKVLPLKDHAIIEGHRNETDQNAAFDRGDSKLRWPDGNHNSLPSKAIDVRPHPWPVDEDMQREELSYLAGLYVGIASELGLKLRWGGDWDRDGEASDNHFDDLFHIEIVGG